MFGSKTLWQGDSQYAHYEVVEQQYNRRPARVLFSGDREAVQSGLALDDNPELLFDYNQRFLELAQALQPSRVLLVGGGTMTFPTALLAALPSVLLDVVERDEQLAGLAARYFGFTPNARLNLYHSDGRVFLRTISEPYDLLLIDAFSHLHIPEALSTLQAVTAMRAALTPSGRVAVNIVSPYYGRSATIVRQQLAAYRAVFERVDVFTADTTNSGWQHQNLVLVAGQGEAAPPFRFDALPPLDVADEAPLQDL